MWENRNHAAIVKPSLVGNSGTKEFGLWELRVGQFREAESYGSRSSLQEAINASDIIGRWEYDAQNDRGYVDAIVALLFNIDPASAAAGVSINVFLAGIHPEDRERAADQFRWNAKTGLCGVIQYRVCSADGVTRWVLDRGRIALDEARRPQRGSGILIDITQSRLSGPEEDLKLSYQPQHPLERATAHCLAARKALHEHSEPLLHRMSDMLLLEVGRSLSKLIESRRHREMN